MTVPEQSPVREPLTPVEQMVYEILMEAAENNSVCPDYLDLNEVCGFESSSASPGVVKRIEKKGWIKVERYQRFRQVMIVETEKWTARSPSQHTTNPHVRRGCGAGSRSPYPTERKGYRGRVS